MTSSIRFTGTVAALAALCSMLGCDDPKARITLLEQDNRALLMENNTLGQQLSAAQAEADACRNELLASRGHIQSLQSELSRKPDLPADWTPVAGGGAMIAIEGNLLFPPGKITLRDQSKGLISKLASEINGSFADKNIFVFGHTDNDPIKKSGWADNRELSSERALTVVRELQANGITGNRIVACGWGEYRPVTSNTSSDGKAKNRRVEIFAVDPALVSAR